MTDKQIIIDGIDVSGCELYRNDNGVFAPDGTAERTELCYLTNDYCGNNPNCYYKQFKRSEAQCEVMFVLHTDLEKRYKAKEQECEELKKLNEHTEIELESYFIFEENVNKQLDKLKQTLIEIKEIAEKAAKCLYTTESDDYTDGYRWLGSLILQKIRKCEVENERILSGE